MKQCRAVPNSSISSAGEEQEEELAARSSLADSISWHRNQLGSCNSLICQLVQHWVSKCTNCCLPSISKRFWCWEHSEQDTRADAAAGGGSRSNAGPGDVATALAVAPQHQALGPGGHCSSQHWEPFQAGSRSSCTRISFGCLCKRCKCRERGGDRAVLLKSDCTLPVLTSASGAGPANPRAGPEQPGEH